MHGNMQKHARVAQLVERDLAKVEAAGSSPVSRSFITRKKEYPKGCSFFSCKKSPKGLFTMAWIKIHTRFEVSAHRDKTWQVLSAD